MKTLLILSITTLIAAFSMEQGNGIELAEYEVQVSCHKDSLEFLEAPSASTDCENGGISVSYMDLQFSGGKYGTIQREWTYADSCGNEGTALQYLALYD